MFTCRKIIDSFLTIFFVDCLKNTRPIKTPKNIYFILRKFN